MMKEMLKTMTLLGCLWLPATAFAQKADTLRIKGESFTVEVIGGKVLFNGKEWTGDEPLILDDDGDVEIEVRSPRHRQRIIRRGPAGALWFDRDDDDERENVFAFDTDDATESLMGRLHDRMFRLHDDAAFFPGDHEGAFGDVFRDRMMGNKEIRKMEREAEQLAREVRKAEGEARTQRETELRGKLAEIFDKKMALREEDMQHRQEALAKDRQQLDKRRQARGEIIERRLHQLLGERDVFAW